MADGIVVMVMKEIVMVVMKASPAEEHAAKAVRGEIGILVRIGINGWLALRIRRARIRGGRLRFLTLRSHRCLLRPVFQEREHVFPESYPLEPSEIFLREASRPPRLLEDLPDGPRREPGSHHVLDLVEARAGSPYRRRAQGDQGAHNPTESCC